MNEIVKNRISERLIKAMESENLSVNETSEIIGIKPPYVSMIKNPKLWNKCTFGAWEGALDWVNSGYPLRKYLDHKSRNKKENEEAVAVSEPTQIEKQELAMQKMREQVEKEERTVSTNDPFLEPVDLLRRELKSIEDEILNLLQDLKNINIKEEVFHSMFISLANKAVSYNNAINKLK